MKGMVAILCVAMSVALIWSNKDEIQRFINNETDRMGYREPYVHAEPEHVYAHCWEHPDWQRAQIEDSRARADRSRAEREYEYAVENGLVPSGAGDVDEALSVHKRLDYIPQSKWPQRWRDRYYRGQDETRARATKGEPEKFIGASEEEPPAWVGKPAGRVSTKKALSRFVFGMEDE